MFQVHTLSCIDPYITNVVLFWYESAWENIEQLKFLKILDVSLDGWSMSLLTFHTTSQVCLNKCLRRLKNFIQEIHKIEGNWVGNNLYIIQLVEWQWIFDQWMCGSLSPPPFSYQSLNWHCFLFTAFSYLQQFKFWFLPLIFDVCCFLTTANLSVNFSFVQKNIQMWISIHYYNSVTYLLPSNLISDLMMTTVFYHEFWVII